MSILQSSFWFFFTLRYKIVFCYSSVKGPLSLVSAIFSQRTAVLVYLFYKQRLLSLLLILFTKDYVLVSCYSFVKDRCPCLSLFIRKGRCPCPFAIHLQRTAVIVFLLLICKGPRSLSPAIQLPKTAVLV